MDINVRFVGWMRDDSKNTDKVYVIVDCGLDSDNSTFRNIVALYGKRGNRLQGKHYRVYRWDSGEKLMQEKMRKGYKDISSSPLEEVYPEFKQDIEEAALMAMMSI